MQNAIVVSSSSGQVLCPREAAVLVLYLKDLNMVAPDKWGTCQLIALVEQVSKNVFQQTCYQQISCKLLTI